jgi:hypothetical protein
MAYNEKSIYMSFLCMVNVMLNIAVSLVVIWALFHYFNIIRTFDCFPQSCKYMSANVV